MERSFARKVAVALGSLALLPPMMAPAGEERPSGLIEVDTVVSFEAEVKLVEGKPPLVVRTFNRARPYAASINRGLPGFDADYGRMARSIVDREQAGWLVVDRFGDPGKPAGRVDVLVGRSVPAGLVQSVVGPFVDRAAVPVRVALIADEPGTFNAGRIYVGPLVPVEAEPLTFEQVRNLLKPGLSTDEMAKLLPTESIAAKP